MKSSFSFVLKCLVIMFFWSLLVLMSPFPGKAFGLELRDYYPVQSGYGWLYQQTDTLSQTPHSHIEVIHEVEQSGSTVFRLAQGGSINFPTERQKGFRDLDWDSQGLKIYRIVEKESNPEENVDVTFDPPDLYIPANLEPGQQAQVVLGTVTLEAVGQTVEVPAGTFPRCIRLGFHSADQDCPDTKVWLAPGVGKIKSQEICLEDGVKNTETSELVAARIDNHVIGNLPLCNGKVVSFAFSTIQEKGCSMLLDGIAIQGHPETYWAKFDFNPETLTLDVDWGNVGVGSGVLGPTGCGQFPGLDFTLEEPYLWDCKNGFYQTAGIFDTVRYAGATYFTEFVFEDSEPAFHLVRIWDQYGTLFWAQ